MGVRNHSLLFYLWQGKWQQLITIDNLYGPQKILCTSPTLSDLYDTESQLHGTNKVMYHTLSQKSKNTTMLKNFVQRIRARSYHNNKQKNLCSTCDKNRRQVSDPLLVFTGSI